jgi:hypothetical protein
VPVGSEEVTTMFRNPTLAVAIIASLVLAATALLFAATYA